MAASRLGALALLLGLLVERSASASVPSAGASACPAASFSSVPPLKVGGVGAGERNVHAAAPLALTLRGGQAGDDMVYNQELSAGLGMALTKDKLGNHVVQKLMKGYPAEQSGEVHEKDIIIEVDGKPVWDLDSTGLLGILRGPVGTFVELVLQRGDDAQIVTVQVERQPPKLSKKPKKDKKSSKSSASGMFMNTFSAATASVGTLSSSMMGLVGSKGGKEGGGKSAGGKVGAPVGIGLGFSLNNDDQFVVTKLVPDGPAERSGELEVGDIIVRVDGVVVDGLTSKELIAHIRGPAGTAVVLDVRRDGEDFCVSLMRGDGKQAAQGKSSSSSMFNYMNKKSAEALQSISSSTHLSKATASIGSGIGSGLSSLQSLAASLPSFQKKAKKELEQAVAPPVRHTPAPAPVIAAPLQDPVGVGLGIKRNHHGDFMVTEIADGGVAAESGKIMVGDVVSAVGTTAVHGLKSAALRDLILGQPGSHAMLTLSRWVPPAQEGGEGEWETISVDLVRRKSKSKAKKAPASTAKGASKAAAKPKAAA